MSGVLQRCTDEELLPLLTTTNDASYHNLRRAAAHTPPIRSHYLTLYPYFAIILRVLDLLMHGIPFHHPFTLALVTWTAGWLLWISIICIDTVAIFMNGRILFTLRLIATPQ